MFLESFLQLAAPSIRNRDRIELPFGRGRTSPVAAVGVAQLVDAVLADPVPHLGLIYELQRTAVEDSFLKMRESMGREGKPLLDFNSNNTAQEESQCILYANYGSPVSLHPPR
jgi:hypothetical protein